MVLFVFSKLKSIRDIRQKKMKPKNKEKFPCTPNLCHDILIASESLKEQNKFHRGRKGKKKLHKEVKKKFKATQN